MIAGILNHSAGIFSKPDSIEKLFRNIHPRNTLTLSSSNAEFYLGATGINSTSHLLECPHLELTYAWDGWIEPMYEEGIIRVDSAWIAESYRQTGMDFLKKLHGDFVIALWDAKKKTLILARDPVGTKQIYYFYSPDAFVFSTRLASFFDADVLTKKINNGMVGQYLIGELLDYDSTFYKGICQIPPAHFLTVQLGQTSPVIARYWDPNSIKIQTNKNAAEYHEEFFEHFKRAVGSRLDTKNTTGLLLSGGLDSSQICAMAETIRTQKPEHSPVYSACLIAEGFLQEEKELLAALGEKYGCEIETVPYFEQQSHSSLFELFQNQGETPNGDGFLTTAPLMKKFAEKGCKKILTGFGANELSNPFEVGYLLDLMFQLKIPEFLIEVKRYAFTLQSSVLKTVDFVGREALTEKTPFFIRKEIRRQRNQKRAWLRDDFKKEILIEPSLRLRPFKDLMRNKPYHALFEPLIPSSLTIMNDCAAEYGMEVGHPFLDFKLICFFLSVPGPVKIRDGYRKKFIQTSLKKIMPVPVKHRDQDTYFVPLPSLEQRRLAEIQSLQKYFSNPQSPLFNYLNYSAVQEVMVSPARMDALGYPMLWKFARLGAWLEKQSKSRDY